ncbi:MAG: serine protease [Actinobacteria bacterium]|nr:serine protease [Actinomycetota bacterium]
MIQRTVPKEFDDLVQVQADHQDRLLDKSNVVGVAIGNKVTGDEVTDERSITVLVDTKFDASLLGDEDMVPDVLDGVPTDVQEVGVIQAGGPAMTMNRDIHLGELDISAPRRAETNGAELTHPTEEAPLAEQITPFFLKTRMRPAMGGFSCGHYKVTAGTIATGCYDRRYMPGIPQAYYLLSNNHVLANSNNANIGDPVVQPGIFDGGTVASDTIGRLARFVPLKYKTATTTPLNYVDAAIAQVDFHNLNREIYWIGYVKKLYVAPTLGQIVQKTGRTTNFTTGKVTNINATVDVNYGSGRVARFARQILTTNMSAPGDSGSLVTNLEEQGVGLLFAGSSEVTVINHLHYVQSLLGVRVTET